MSKCLLVLDENVTLPVDQAFNISLQLFKFCPAFVIVDHSQVRGYILSCRRADLNVDGGG